MNNRGSIMASLERTLRRQLENTVKQARRVAEAGGRKAVEQLAVHHHEPWSSMSPEQRQLRNRLRAHGRQLGDRRDERRGIQSIDRLVGECAYEHWHRMLFARFLAENDLLIEPETGVPITLAECQELARDKNQDWLEYASSLAVRMLQEIFRPDDPVLQVNLPPETVSVLEDLLKGLPCEVFTAGDSLGWCYQFWQAERKDEVNASGNKIGADELPAVTQLFTEDYMVDFLLDNTLGAWYAGKVLAENPELAANAKDEDELRNAVALPGCLWKYLRFVKVAEDSSIGNQRQDAAATMGKTSSPSKQESIVAEASSLCEQNQKNDAIVAEASSLCNQSQDGSATIWRPAAGTFDGWPKTAKLLTCLDPCMGSGHFEVAMFERLVALRMAEEGLDEATSVAAVIRDNLFGLEIDPRCTQIAAFNLALAAWRRVGYRPLPPMNLACSGLAPNTSEADWLALAGNNEKVQNGVARLYRLFKGAPVLGSLINPRAGHDDLLLAEFHELQPLLEEALAQEIGDDAEHEMAVTAQGLAKAAEILVRQFTLVATNVPYLGRGKQDDVLLDYCERVHPEAKADLATCFVERCLGFCAIGSTTALVTPQNWLFLKPYTKLRSQLLETKEWRFVARLGAGAFETITGEVVQAILVSLDRVHPRPQQIFFGIDAARGEGATKKANLIHTLSPILLNQDQQRQVPDSRVIIGELGEGRPLQSFCECFYGICSGDSPRFLSGFWELPKSDKTWTFLQDAVSITSETGGMERVLLWEEGKGQYYKFICERLGETGVYAWIRGGEAWGKRGVSISRMGDLACSLYYGELFDQNVAVVVPRSEKHLAPLWCFLRSENFVKQVRVLDQKLSVTPRTMKQVSFDLAHWQKIAAEKYPNGLPKPFSSDPTQWLFNGHPHGSDQPLQVAVARLLGYQWPRQTGSSFPDCPALGPDGLESFADDDGIVCLHPVNREQPAASRLRSLLAAAFGDAWSAGKERELLAAAGMKKGSLEDWLSDGFFEQHCALFHQRPFIWHIWDGRQDGFNALVNYHRLADSGRGFQPLESAAGCRSHYRAPLLDQESAAGCRCHYEGTHAGRRTLEKLIYTYLGDWITRQRQDQQQGVEGADARLAAALHLQSELKLILKGEPSYDLFVRWKPLHKQAIGWDPDINDGVRMNIRPFMTARPLNARAKNASILRITPKIKWTKDRGKEPERPKEDYPWFWGWDEKTQEFKGGKTFDGNRWNDLHYTNAFKQAARKGNKT